MARVVATKLSFKRVDLYSALIQRFPDGRPVDPNDSTRQFWSTWLYSRSEWRKEGFSLLESRKNAVFDRLHIAVGNIRYQRLVFNKNKPRRGKEYMDGYYTLSILEEESELLHDKHDELSAQLEAMHALAIAKEKLFQMTQRVCSCSFMDAAGSRLILQKLEVAKEELEEVEKALMSALKATHRGERRYSVCCSSCT